MNPDKVIIKRQQKTIYDLKAEITYWKETAENWKDLYKEADSGLQYLKSYSSNLEKALNNSIKKY